MGRASATAVHGEPVSPSPGRASPVSAPGAVESVDPAFARVVGQLTNTVSLSGCTRVAEFAVGDGHLTNGLLDVGVEVLAIDSSRQRLARLEAGREGLRRALFDLSYPIPAGTLNGHDAVVSAFGFHRYSFRRQIEQLRHWTEHTKQRTAFMTAYGFESVEDFRDQGRPQLLPPSRANYVFGEELVDALRRVGVHARWHANGGNTGMLIARQPG